MLTTRRQILSGTVSGLMANLMSKSALADDLESPIELIDEDTRGQLGERDLIESGMDVRAAKQSFVFPDDANDNRPYGIDVSHHIKDVPWTALQAAKCQYVYVKATQSTRGASKPVVRTLTLQR